MLQGAGRIARPGPGEAADDASAIERERRQQVDAAEQEVHDADHQGDSPDHVHRPAAGQLADQRDDQERGPSDEAHEWPGSRHEDLVAGPGGLETRRGGPAEEVHDDRAARQPDVARREGVPELVREGREQERGRHHRPDDPPTGSADAPGRSRRPASRPSPR